MYLHKIHIKNKYKFGGKTMNIKYAVVVAEVIEGWNQKNRKLLLFDDCDQAKENLISYYEAQDSDYKVEVQEIGYVEVIGGIA
jgi:hypothetical protein